jgi:hypothetical protein
VGGRDLTSSNITSQRGISALLDDSASLIIAG